MKNKIAEKIAYLLPFRIMYWVAIRLWSYTTTHECSNKSPDETTLFEVLKSWESKTNIKV